jgi:hypothetical protein
MANFLPSANFMLHNGQIFFQVSIMSDDGQFSSKCQLCQIMAIGQTCPQAHLLPLGCFLSMAIISHTKDLGKIPTKNKPTTSTVCARQTGYNGPEWTTSKLPPANHPSTGCPFWLELWLNLNPVHIWFHLDNLRSSRSYT